ncbi:MAG: hypothetical protein KKH52_00010 [Nanoarchaeota archaeon]|nr:hypothetical protein [Nanoarchaeota archaeon]MBU1622975.1 hypothetical protein [Nanoarchaeota archaeon]MBU1973759.1 hypothetical protein [Nanoarchaeota archaeon]
MKKYPLNQLKNWYFGNHCTRKCFDKDNRLRDCYDKLQLFVEKNPAVRMTHRNFLDLFNDHLNVCKLDSSFKRRSIGWKLFERLSNTPNYDSDKIIVVNGKIEMVGDKLGEPKYCPICKALGIH